jgi:hypothetical protein
MMDRQETEQLQSPISEPGGPTRDDPARAPQRAPWLQYRTPRGFEWNRYIVPIAALPPELEGLRIAHLTDLHLKSFWSDAFDELIERVRSEKVDLILFTGDFVDNKRRPERAVGTVRKLFSSLESRLGCYAILGNHDRYHLAPHLEGLPITLLDRESRRIHIDGAELELLALPGVDRKHLTRTVLESYPEKKFGVPRLILAHFPDHLRKAADLRPDLYFAGHTHGGQICLPNGYPPVRHDSLPRRLCKGVHRAANTWLVVSRGLGFTGLPLRVFCPTEVVEITLTRG